MNDRASDIGDHADNRDTDAIRRDPHVRQIVLAWRRLTSPSPSRRAGAGAPTLLACSGGVDSSAMALALAETIRGSGGNGGNGGGGGGGCIGHVVHDIRSPEASQRDRDVVRQLAERVHLPFVEARIEPRREVEASGGNLEGVARTMRYRALEQLARDTGCTCVATGHHADDQLESLLMALVRGAGPHGMRGLAAKRPISPDSSITVVRPLLHVTRDTCKAICTAAGFHWIEDPTNADVGKLRNAIRHDVIPVLRNIREDGALNAARYGQLLADVSGLIDDRVATLWQRAEVGYDGGNGVASMEWNRGMLAQERRVIIGACLHRAVEEIGEGQGLDRFGSGASDRVIDAVKDGSTDPRHFTLCNTSVMVRSHVVRVEGRNHGDDG